MKWKREETQEKKSQRRKKNALVYMKQSPSAAAANRIWSICALKHQTMNELMYLCNIMKKKNNQQNPSTRLQIKMK